MTQNKTFLVQKTWWDFLIACIIAVPIIFVSSLIVESSNNMYPSFIGCMGLILPGTYLIFSFPEGNYILFNQEGVTSCRRRLFKKKVITHYEWSSLKNVIWEDNGVRLICNDDKKSTRYNLSIYMVYFVRIDGKIKFCYTKAYAALGEICKENGVTFINKKK